MIQALPAGNALRVFLRPPDGVARWKLLRKVSDTFSGPDDDAAVVVHDGDDAIVVDAYGLANGVPYYYRPYYRSGDTWVAGATASGTPAASYVETTPDFVTVVRERLEAGLLVELQRGTLQHDNGAIPVFTAPPAYGQATWPIVSVHLTNEDPAERFIGEQMAEDVFDEDTQTWAQAEGWLAKVELAIVGWSLNSDERLALRKALRRIVIANLPVFDSHGFVNVSFGQQDMEDFESYAAPVYQAMCTLSCIAPVSVGSEVGVIRDVVQTVS